jgi:hypothetical protein
MIPATCTVSFLSILAMLGQYPLEIEVSDLVLTAPRPNDTLPDSKDTEILSCIIN